MILRLLFATLFVVAAAHAIARLPIDYAVACDDIAVAQMTIPFCNERPSTTAVDCRRNRRLAQRWPWELALQYTTAHMFTHLPRLPENRTLEAVATNGWALAAILFLTLSAVGSVIGFCNKAGKQVSEAMGSGGATAQEAAKEASEFVRRLLSAVDQPVSVKNV